MINYTSCVMLKNLTIQPIIMWNYNSCEKKNWMSGTESIRMKKKICLSKSCIYVDDIIYFWRVSSYDWLQESILPFGQDVLIQSDE